ncbi:hypothetical protein QUF74_02105 [Candidatus Halobeggiatoa sp. HSG11]|nr:hypothetical protein [Candidatus Halobeggiatoa sp. HSG11]
MTSKKICGLYLMTFCLNGIIGLFHNLFQMGKLFKFYSLVNKIGTKGAENHLKQILYNFQSETPQKSGYLVENIFNLLHLNN